MTAAPAAPTRLGAPVIAGSIIPMGPIAIPIPPAAAAISFATAELPARGLPGPLFLPPTAAAGGLGIMSGGIVVVVVVTASA